MLQTRKLDLLESMLAPPKICNVLVPTKIQVKKAIDKKILEEAVKIFIKSQPNLNSGIKTVNNELHFVPLTELRDVFDVLPTSTNWKSICFKYSNELLRSDFENYSPLKVFFSPPADSVAYLIVAFLHYCGDGTNGMTIANCVLQIYRELRTTGSVTLKEHLPPPSATEMAKSTYDENYEECKKLFINNQLEQIRKCDVIFPYENEESNETIYYSSTKYQLIKFVECCKINNCTIGSALMAAMSFSFSGYIFDNGNKELTSLAIRINIPYNLRGRVSLDIPADCVNLAVTDHLLSPTVTKSKCFWELSKEIREEMLANMENKFHLFEVLGTQEVMESVVSLKRIKENGGIRNVTAVSNMKWYVVIVVAFVLLFLLMCQVKSNEWMTMNKQSINQSCTKKFQKDRRIFIALFSH